MTDYDLERREEIFSQKVMHFYLNLFYKGAGVKNNNTNEGGLQTVTRKCPVSYSYFPDIKIWPYPTVFALAVMEYAVGVSKFGKNPMTLLVHQY